MNIKVLPLRQAGMFSNVNEVIQQCYLAEKSGYSFIIDWSESCYRDNEKSGDPWLYYFNPCFPEVATGDLDLQKPYYDWTLAPLEFSASLNLSTKNRVCGEQRSRPPPLIEVPNSLLKRASTSSLELKRQLPNKFYQVVI